MVDFPKIRKVYIKNFRSIAELEFDATDFTILVGNNDCGKSNVFRALNLFFNGETNPGEKFDFETDYNKFAPVIAKKAKEITVCLTFDMPDNYQHSSGERLEWTKTWRSNGLQDKQIYRGLDYKQWARKTGSRWVRRHEEPKRTSKSYSLLRLIQYEYIPAIRSPLYLRKLRGRIYEAIAASAEGNFRKKSKAFEKSISETLTDLTDVLKGKLSDDTTLRLPNDLSELFESLDFLSGDKSISLSNRGDGIKARYIPFLLQFISDKLYESNNRRTFIWAYEEPENNLEFNKSRALADDLIELAEEEEIQLFVTTHSPIFYNLHESNTELCIAYHLSKNESEEGTICISTESLPAHLDEHMGVMSIIAPHILSAQKEVEVLMSQAQGLQEQLAMLNPDNRPTIFVEGTTEYKLFSALLTKFRNGLSQQVFLAEPPVRAGANYVTNMLRSWEFRVKHLPTADRKKAVGIVDNDLEGNRAERQFSGDVKKPKHTECIILSTPSHLRTAFDAGLCSPIYLEHLWPPQIWNVAIDQRWVIPSPLKGKLSEEVMTRIIEGNESLDDIFTQEDQVYLKHLPAEGFKVAWIEHMLSMPNDQLEEHATHFLNLLDSIAVKLRLAMPGWELV